MQKSIIKIENLSHRYSKDWAIKDINFEIKSHGILGLLGSNGAGKSTTMNVLCGALNPTNGRVLINGIEIQKKPEMAKKLIGFLPQKAPLYLDLTVDEYLTHCAHLRLIKPKNIRKSLEWVKDRCGIAHFSKRLLKNLSGGYQQRVGIAQAIIHDPMLVVLDEPTNGLDPLQIMEVRKLIKEIGDNRTVILSTHILSEVQATCDDIEMIEKGRLVFSGTLQEFNDHLKPNTLIMTLDSPPPSEKLTSIPGITQVSLVDKHNIRLHYEKDVADLLVKKSVDKEWGLKQIYVEKKSLDDIFANLAKENC